MTACRASRGGSNVPSRPARTADKRQTGSPQRSQRAASAGNLCLAHCEGVMRLLSARRRCLLRSHLRTAVVVVWGGGGVDLHTRDHRDVNAAETHTLSRTNSRQSGQSLSNIAVAAIDTQKSCQLVAENFFLTDVQLSLNLPTLITYTPIIHLLSCLRASRRSPWNRPCSCTRRRPTPFRQGTRKTWRPGCA